jgi:protein tyrosine phosphatase (PTP) superfamily phosphohydrolase (DUF442 family)
LPDEANLMHMLGMTYYHIPVAWEKPIEADFDQFVQVMQAVTDKPILVHCAGNYRATAFVALYGMAVLGWSDSQADAVISAVWQPEKHPVWAAFIAALRKHLQQES